VELKPSVSKDSLYQAARQWLEEYAETAQTELQVDDQQAGQLIGTVNHHYQFQVRDTPQPPTPDDQEKPYSIHLRHTLHLELKDGQYRYRIYDFSAWEEIRDLSLNDELDPTLGQVPEPRAGRSARSRKKREEMFLAASFPSRLLTGLEEEVTHLTQSLKSALARAAAAK
jgi:hypothetical protein